MEQKLKGRIGLALLIAFLLSGAPAIAQLPNKVGSLINADRTMAKLSASETPYQALLSMTDKETVFFSPGPVQGLKHMKNRPNVPDLMHWNPSFSGIAKSMEFGFTTGPVTFQRIGAPKRNGQYLTVWKRDRKGLWKISAHAISENYGNSKTTEEEYLPNAIFIEPDSSGYLKHRSQVRLNQRKDVVESNDRLFATILKTDNTLAFLEFLADDVRFYFPWNEPIKGKIDVLDYLEAQNLNIETEIEHVDRAYSGELAYSYGTASIRQNGPPKKYNYIRVWQRQDDHQWRVIIEFYSER